MSETTGQLPSASPLSALTSLSILAPSKFEIGTGGGGSGSEKQEPRRFAGRSRLSPAAAAAATSVVAPEKSVLSEDFDAEVRPYIDLVDKLRSLGVDEDVNLPTVVVIGDQSSGKSSVLEAISAVKLPRGTGIVTRCALELRMKKTKPGSGRKQAGKDGEESDWKATVSRSNSGVRKRAMPTVVTSPEAVEQEIRKAQDELAGIGRDVCLDDRILLEVESPTVPDLTLIDLPGIARLATKGQRQDIETRIKTLIRRYIDKEEAIILCVIPCNVDIATTEALKIAREVDPQMIRTLGVLTKPDLIDRGAEKEVAEIAKNKPGSDFYLNLGYTMVKCRKQEQIDAKMSLEDSLEEEEQFFDTHKYFSALATNERTGVKALSRKLTKQLVCQIQRSLPKLNKNVAQLLKEADDALEYLGEPVNENKSRFLLKLLHVFGEVIEEAGFGDYKSIVSEDEQLYAVVHERFAHFANRMERLQADESSWELQKISQTLRNCRGRELPTFLSFTVFRSFALQKVNEIQKPAFKLLDKVQHDILKIADQIAERHFKRFPNLLYQVRDKINEYLQKRMKEASKDIKRIFNTEQWIYTQDKNFRGLISAVEQRETELQLGSGLQRQLQRVPVPAATVHSVQVPAATGMLELVRNSMTTMRDDMTTEAREMLKKLKEYHKVVTARLGDTIPMTVYFSMIASFVADVKQNLPGELAFPREKASHVRRDSGSKSGGEEEEKQLPSLSVDDLLQETLEIAQSRQKYEKMLKRLKQAERELTRGIYSIRQRYGKGQKEDEE